MTDGKKLTQQQTGGYQQYRMQEGILLDPADQCWSLVDAQTELSTSVLQQGYLQSGLQLHRNIILNINRIVYPTWNTRLWRCTYNWIKKYYTIL